MFGPAVLGDRPTESFECRGWQVNVFAAVVPFGAAADPVAASRAWLAGTDGSTACSGAGAVVVWPRTWSGTTVGFVREADESTDLSEGPADEPDRRPMGQRSSSHFGSFTMARASTRTRASANKAGPPPRVMDSAPPAGGQQKPCVDRCLLYTSDAADEEDSVDL